MEKIQFKSFEEMDSQEIKEYYQNFVSEIQSSTRCPLEQANFQAIFSITGVLKAKKNPQLEKFWFETLKPAYAQANNFKAQMDLRTQDSRHYKQK